MRFGNKTEGEHEDYQDKAKRLVMVNYNLFGIGTPKGSEIEPLEEYEIYVVWFVKALQNWKCLISTMRPDDRYYEITYDGDKKQSYIDTYVKSHNTVVTDEELMNL